MFVKKFALSVATLKRALLGASAIALIAIPSAPALADIKWHHVLLISVDGMHATDLSNYVNNHPTSALAKLALNGVQYPNALSSGPSDSFPGLTALVTGATPKTSGVYYDVSYDRTLYAPNSKCLGQPGAVPAYAENLDKDSSSYTAGGTLGDVKSQIDPTQLPLALVNGSCVGLYPHSFIKVNTIFEVIRKHGGQTAWADKHPAYDLVNGPSGLGVQDLFTPEVNSNDTKDGITPFPTDPDWFPIDNTTTGTDTTKGYHSVARNDLRKVHAVLNEINGYRSTDDARTGTKVGVPNIFGMNFQAVSVGQKLPVGNKNDKFDCDGAYPASCLKGGYLAGGLSPNSGLQFGLDFVNSQVGAMVQELRNQGLANDTLIIISAKHGQSPIDVSQRQAYDDGPYANTPGIARDADGNATYTTDDVALIWLQPQTQQKTYKDAKDYLLRNASLLGITQLLDKSDLAPRFGNPFGNERTPDFIAFTKQGLIYTGGTKLAEHGGFAKDDRNVALLVSNPSIGHSVNYSAVETRQVAPTILNAFGTNSNELDGARMENSKALPGF